MKTKTRVVILLDRSGSMKSVVEPTVNGYNEHVQQIKADAKEQDIQVSLVTFNATVMRHFWDESADMLQEASQEDYNPNGGTALYDAICTTIDHLKATETDPDVAYLLIIISDGEDTSYSSYNRYLGYTAKDACDRIAECENSGRWTVALLGCEKADLQKFATDMGIKGANLGLWSKCGVAADNAMRGSTEKLGGYFKSRKAGAMKSDNFYAAPDEAVLGFADMSDYGAKIASAAPVVDSVQMNVCSNTCSNNLTNVFGQGEAVSTPKVVS